MILHALVGGGFSSATDITILDTVPHVVKSLSREAGITVRVAPIFQQHAIFISRSGQKPLDSLRLIGQALGADLVESGSRQYDLVLNRSIREEQIRSLQRQRAGLVRARIEANQAFRKKRIARDTWDSAATRWVRELEEKAKSDPKVLNSIRWRDYNCLLPTSQFLEEAVMAIGPDRLGRIPTGVTEYYSSQPSQGCVYAQSLQAVLARFEAKRRSFSSNEIATLTRKTRTLGNDFAFGLWTEEDGVTSEIRLKVFPSVRGVAIQLTGYSSSGKQTLVSAMSADSLLEGMDELPPEDGESGDSKPEGDLLPETVKALDYLSTPTLPLPSWFRQPETYEPLSAFASEIIARSLQPSSRPQAVDVPDGITTYINIVRKGNKLPSRQFWRYINSQNVFKKIDTPLGVAWQLTDPDGYERQWVPREHLGRQARQVALVGRDLRAEGKLLGVGSETFPAYRAIQWHSALRTLRQGLGEDLWPMELKAFVGRLPDPAWSRLLAGDVLRADECGCADLLGRLLADCSWLPLFSKKPISDLIRAHPIEALTREEISSASLEVRTDSEPVLFFQRMPNEPIFTAPTSWLKGAPVLCRYRASDESFQPLISRADFERLYEGQKFGMGTRGMLVFRVRLKDWLWIESKSPDEGQMMGNLVSYEQLPVSLRDAVWKQAVEDGIALEKEIRRKRKELPANTPTEAPKIPR